MGSPRRGATTPKGGEYVRNFWATLAFFANTVAFLFIGLGTNLGQLFTFIVPIGIAYLSVMAARLVSVYSILQA